MQLSSLSRGFAIAALPAAVSAFMPSAHFARSSASFPLHSSGWSVADDWSNLSSENQQVDTSEIFNADLAAEAARRFEQEFKDAAASGGGVAVAVPDPEDDFIAGAVDAIQLFVDPTDPPLYDTPGSFESYANADSFVEDASREIGLLVRCNESPDHLLVAEGRALAPLTDVERYDAAQLVRAVESKEGAETYETTEFFDRSVAKIFHEHAVATSTTPEEEDFVLDASGVASWLTKSLGDAGSIGQHAKEVSTIISRYSTYGSGTLTEEQFHAVYLDAVVGAITAGKKAGKVATWKSNLKVTQPTVVTVWRDFRNHGIFPPAEEEREKLQAEIDARHGTAAAAEGTYMANTLFDECEILEWVESDGDTLSKRPSNELVELASDGKTPKRIRDGSFVFIDEESCIGCSQCATVAPSTFTMLEDGRARTFEQSTSPEVKTAVSSCPVSCMHYVGFDELKKYEKARDDGEYGGRSHIPLHVARRDSSANRRSSWYHSLRHKCSSSKQCPQKGCYDCPLYTSPGANPYFQAQHRKAESARARELMESGEADKYRKTAEL